MPQPKSITILGAGLTGLVSAYQLSRALPSTSRITLVDSTNRLGGWVRSKRHAVRLRNDKGEVVVEGEVVCEQGPRSIRPKGSPGAAGMLRLIRDLDMLDSMIPISKTHPSARNRFILDLSSPQPELSKLTLNPFKSHQPLLRGILTEPFRRSNTPSDDDESVDSFLRRRFGGTISDLGSAGMHGIYASSSTQLSARAVMGGVYEGEREYGSVLLGMMRRGWKSEVREEKREVKEEWRAMGELGKRREGWSMYGLKGGLQSLSDRLGEAVRHSGVDIRLGEKVTGLAVDEGRVTVTTNRSSRSTDHLIAALPPALLSPLFPPSSSLPHLRHNLSTSVGVTNLVFPLPPSAIHPDGFGYLVPRPQPGGNPENVLGVVFDSTALPGLDSSSVEGKVTKLTVMMGGPYWSIYPSSPTNPDPAPRPGSAEQLVEPALKHLRRVFPVLESVEPIVTAPHLHLDCIPTYLPGHVTRLRELHEAIRDGPWAGKLSLAGNGYGGVGVNDCVWSVDGIVKGLVEGRAVTGLERWAAPSIDDTSASTILPALSPQAYE